MKKRQYIFKGRKYIAPNGIIEGPLCTVKQYELGKMSFAHIYPEGIIRFGKKIGTKKDLRFDKWVEVSVHYFRAMYNMMNWF